MNIPTGWQLIFESAWRASAPWLPGWQHIAAQCKAESDFDPAAVSPAGAQGPMQFMEDTWNDLSSRRPWMGSYVNALNPAIAIPAAAAYLTDIRRYLSTHCLLDVADVPIELIWAGYNWGMCNAAKCYREHGDAWQYNVPKETAGYIERIERFIGE